MGKEKAVRRHKRCVRRKMGLKRFVKSFPPFLLVMVFMLPAIAAEGPGEKLAGGVEDTATGWIEVPKEMAQTSEDTNIIEGLTVGTIKGAGEAVVKTTKGAVDAATFYIPDAEKDEE
jgi:putative exosortase-associated protein (TIGR04073 family)